MRYLLGHSDVRRLLGSNARKAVETQFTVEQFARRFASVLDPIRFHESGLRLIKA
jgi:hypothetical protein